MRIATDVEFSPKLLQDTIIIIIIIIIIIHVSYFTAV
jgi:hypothetical protein